MRVRPKPCRIDFTPFGAGRDPRRKGESEISDRQSRNGGSHWTRSSAALNIPSSDAASVREIQKIEFASKGLRPHQEGRGRWSTARTPTVPPRVRGRRRACARRFVVRRTRRAPLRAPLRRACGQAKDHPIGCAIARANATASRAGTRRPSTPSVTTSRQPGTSVVTSGRPHAAASIRLLGSPSR